MAGTLLQAAFLAFSTTIATVGAVNVEVIWRYLDRGRIRLVSEAVAATESAGTAPAATPGWRSEPASPVRVGALASGLTPRGRVATVPLATVAERRPSTAAPAARCVASGRAERRLDDSTLVQTIAACASIAALDSLEAQLHAAFPSDPSLQPGARALRRLEARRAQLALPGAPITARSADASGASAPMR